MSGDAGGGGGDHGHGGGSKIMGAVVGGVILFVVVITIGTIASCGDQVRIGGAGGAAGLNSYLSMFRNNGGFFMGLAALIGFAIWARKQK